MSVARNLWRAADAPHIVPTDSVERQTAQRLINACPAGLFSLTPEGGLRVDYHGCLECGTCRLLCDESTLQQWGNDSNLLIVFYVQIMPDDFVMQLHRF